MRTLLTLVLVLLLAVVLGGGVLVAATCPWWACIPYGLAGMWSVPTTLETIGRLWA